MRGKEFPSIPSFLKRMPVENFKGLICPLMERMQVGTTEPQKNHNPSSLYKIRVMILQIQEQNLGFQSQVVFVYLAECPALDRLLIKIMDG